MAQSRTYISELCREVTMNGGDPRLLKRIPADTTLASRGEEFLER